MKTQKGIIVEKFKTLETFVLGNKVGELKQFNNLKKAKDTSCIHFIDSNSNRIFDWYDLESISISESFYTGLEDLSEEEFISIVKDVVKELFDIDVEIDEIGIVEFNDPLDEEIMTAHKAKYSKI